MGYANSKHQVSANYWAVLHETSSSMTSIILVILDEVSLFF